MRAREEFLGSFCSLVWAAKNWTSVVAGLARMAFSSVRALACLSTRRLRFSLRWIAEVFGMAAVSGGGGCGLGFGGLGFDAAEGHPEEAQQVAALVVRVGCRDDRDVEAHALLHVLDRDLREDREVGYPEVVVALAVELRRDSAEVADGRQRDGDHPVEELPHGVPAQRDVAAHDLALLQLEVRDRLAGL